MRCGRCKIITDDIAHVKECYGILPKAATPAKATTLVEPDMTEKQYNYIVNLLHWKGKDESEVSDEFGFTILDCFKEEASEVIDYLKKLPDVNKPSNQPREDEPDVPAGRYALLQPDPDHIAVPDRWYFYQVDKPTKGRWKGRQFLSVLASDEKHPIRDAQRRAAVLERIALDPGKASRDYGLQTGRCGICGKLLTDPHSIRKGIGPICEKKMG